MANEAMGFSERWTEGWTEGRTDGWTESGTDLDNTIVIPSAASTNNKDITSEISIQAFLSPVVFFGNGLILVAIRRSHSMKKVTYLFLGHLAVADLLFGMSMATRFFLILTDNLDKYPCLINMCFVLTSGGSSFTGTLFLSLENYLSLKHLNFKSFEGVITTRVAWGMIAGCWMFWVLFILLSVVLAALNPLDLAPCFLGGAYYERWYLIFISITYFCHLLLVIYYQFGTLVIIRRHFMQLHPQPHVCVDGNIQTSTQNASKRRQLKKLSNLYKLIGMVVGGFFVCWTPFMIVLLAKATCTGDCSKLEKISRWLGSMVIFSSLMNVFIYAAKSPEFREGFRKVLWPRCNRGSVANSDTR